MMVVAVYVLANHITLWDFTRVYLHERLAASFFLPNIYNTYKLGKYRLPTLAQIQHMVIAAVVAV